MAKSRLHSIYKRAQLGIRRASIRLARRLVKSRPDAGEKIDLNSARVLFLRQNQIGDALISTPVFAALKKHYPGITIDVLLNRRNRTVFDTDPNLRTRYVIKQRKLDIFSVLRRIRKERYDFVVDLVHSPSTTSSMFCLFSKAKRTVGPVRENDFVYDVKIPDPQSDLGIPSQESMMRKFMRVLHAFEIDGDTEPLEPYYTLTPQSMDFARAMAARVRGGDSSRALVGVNIAGSKIQKYWGTETWSEFIKRLSATQPHARFVLLYSGEYASRAAEIADASGAALSGETTTLTDFAAAINTLDMLISTDSAAVHFADMFRVPVVTLVLDPPESKLWLPSVTIYESVHSPDHDINTISIDAVLNAVARLHRRLDEELDQLVPFRFIPKEKQPAKNRSRVEQ